MESAHENKTGPSYMKEPRAAILIIITLLLFAMRGFLTGWGFDEAELHGWAGFFAAIIRSTCLMAVPLVFALYGAYRQRGDSEIVPRYYLGLIPLGLFILFVSMTYLVTEYFLVGDSSDIKLRFASIRDLSLSEGLVIAKWAIAFFFIAPFLDLLCHSLKSSFAKRAFILTLTFLILLPSLTNYANPIMPDWGLESAWPILFYFVGFYFAEHKEGGHSLVWAVLFVSWIVVSSAFLYYMCIQTDLNVFGSPTYASAGSLFNLVSVCLFIKIVHSVGLREVKCSRMQKALGGIVRYAFGVFVVLGAIESILYPLLILYIPTLKSMLLCLIPTSVIVLLCGFLLSLVLTELTALVTRVLFTVMQNVFKGRIQFQDLACYECLTIDGGAQSARGTVYGGVLLVLFATLSALLASVVNWGVNTFDVSFDALLMTLGGPLQGTGFGMVQDAISYCLPPTLITLLVVTALVICAHRLGGYPTPGSSGRDDRGDSGFKRCEEGALWIRRAIAVACMLTVMFAFSKADDAFGIQSYLELKTSVSRIYEEEYVNPLNITIVAPEKPKNLVCIYLESMETTYASTEAGGAQVSNLIPNLTQFADENVSFSNSEKLGGFLNTKGTGWTIAALIATTAGIPYSFDNDEPDGFDSENYLSGVVSLGDVLSEVGYNQEFICGSDSVFGCRRAYFQSHGDYEVFDYFTAIENGLIDSDYYVWWGFEDAKLYEYAKTEIEDLASLSDPFNCTLLTVDTHHVDGYICELCGGDYDNQTANVVACADRQVAEFVQWIEDQPFSENTVVVIVGDHGRMDTSLVKDVNRFDRTIYNCFINVDEVESAISTNRVFTPMDMYPTILSALGFSIEGERLALGTNLFSGERTLAEEKGFANFNKELGLSSESYTKLFAPELRSGRMLHTDE